MTTYLQETRTLLATGKPEDYESGQALALSWFLDDGSTKTSRIDVHSGAGKTSILIDLGNRYNCDECVAFAKNFVILKV